MRRTRALFGVIWVILFTAAMATAQQWYVQSADWGAGNRRQDVTNRVRRLVGGGNFRANNQNLGVDPAVGADKTLRITARDRNGRVQTFTYREGATVPSQNFVANDWPNRGGGYSSQLRIVRAEWRPTGGRAGRNVTSRLQGMVRNNRLDITADNRTMGGDPAPGQPKELYIAYEYQRRSQSQTIGENGRVNIP